MRSWVHVVISSILAFVFYQFFEWKVALIFVGGVLIDVDHYWWYIYKYKKWNLFECYTFYSDSIKKRNFDVNIGILLILHTVEFLIAVIILAFYTELALAFLIGLLSHYILDWIQVHNIAGRLIANPSIVMWVIKSIKN